MLNLVHFQFKQYVAECFRRHGFEITPEQFLILDALWDNNVGISQQQLANIVMKDKNSVCKLIDGLEKKGLITRIPDKADRRVNLIKVTPKALEISEKIQQEAKYAVDDIIEGIPEEHLHIFVDVLQKISENLDKPLASGNGATEKEQTK